MKILKKSKEDSIIIEYSQDNSTADNLLVVEIPTYKGKRAEVVQIQPIEKQRIQGGTLIIYLSN